MDGKFPKYIKVSTLNRTSLFEFAANGSSKPKGIVGELLEILTQALSFEYEITAPKDDEHGRLTSDGNWSGTIGMVAKSEADFGMLSIITIPRLQVVDFSIPFIITDTTFATQHPAALPTAYTYIYAFDSYTWMCIAAILFLIPFIVRLGNKKYSYVDTLMAVFGNMLNIPAPLKAFDRKLVTAMLWYFSCYVLAIGYAASVSALLFAPLYNPPIRTFKDLHKAVANNNFKAKTLCGTSLVPDMIASQSEHIKSVGESIMKNKWFLQLNFDAQEELSSPKTAIVLTRIVLNLKLGLPQSAFISEDRTYINLIGFCVRKTFCCKEQLNLALRRIFEAGIIDKLLRDQAWRSIKDPYYQKQSPPYASSHHEVQPLSIKDLSGAFIVLICGFGIAFIAFVTETVLPLTNQSKPLKVGTVVAQKLAFETEKLQLKI